MPKAKQDKKPGLTQADKEDTPKIDYFNYDLIDIDLPELPEGFIQLSTIQVKFDNVGQTVIGLYMGSTVVQSEYDDTKTYRFHKLMLPIGVTVGFAGSKQIDDILNNIMPNQYEVHITYTSSKKMKNNKYLKVFDVVARLREVNRYIGLAAPAEEVSSSEDTPF